MALWKEIWFRAGGTSLRTKSGLALLLCCLTSLLAPTNASTDLLHNSQQFACSIPGYLTEETCVNANGNWNPVSKWGVGGWGIADQQYGKISCATCHVKGNGSGNIKRLRPVITAASGSFPGSTVTAQVAIPGSSSDYGDDDGSHTSSQRVCEVCHSRTYYHRFDTTAQVAEGGNLTHFNGSDCVSCHKHRQGFRAGCSDCHGNSDTGSAWPDGIDNNINRLYSAADDAGAHSRHVAYLGTGNDSCAACHPMPTSTATTHVNTLVDLTASGFGYTPQTQTCSNIACHGNSDARWGGGGACLDCHAVVQGTRTAVAGQLAANSHHIQGVAVSNVHCYQCHWEANFDGTVNAAYHGRNASAVVDLVVYGAGTRPLTYLAETTAIQYTANGDREEIAKLNQHCLGCHGDASNLAIPFGDGKTPKQYAWDGSSIGSRYSQIGTTPWGKYSGINITPKAARLKAYSAHGNAVANQGGWNLSETWPNTRAGTTNVACFDCHNSHGSAVAGRTTSYADVGGGILKDTVSGTGGYSVTYKPVGGGSAEDKDLRNPGASLCFDCHLNAADGGSRPWGYQGTFGATQQILGYFDTEHFASGFSGTQQRYTYRQAISFKGGHFGASSPLKSEAAKSINGLCTPCHDPHGVSRTLNQPYSVPLLKGTWMTSPYREDVAPYNNSHYTIRTDWGHEGVHYRIDQNTFGGSIHALVNGITENDAEFAGLCLQCHPKNRLTDGSTHTWKSKDRVHESVKGWKTTETPVKHKYTCSKCHTAHTGPSLPRLMVTNCLDSSHKGRVGSANPPYVANGTDGWGRIPGSFYSWDPEIDGRIACHEGPNANLAGDTDQSWNLVTAWSKEEPLVLTGGPSAAPSTVSPRATITWTTNLATSSWVDYGPTTAYGLTTGNSYLYTSHTVQLANLTNHSTYHYRVRSTSYKGQEVVSADQTFYVSTPPSVPYALVEPDKGCPAGCSVTLSWYASSDPDGGPVEYEVEVDTVSTFDSPDKLVSGWIPAPATSAVVGPLDSGKTWYWHVRARDANYDFMPSNWSTTRTFKTLAYDVAPFVPTINPSPASISCAEGCSFTLNWSSATNDPDNGSVEYSVQVDDDPSFASPEAASSWISSKSWTAGGLVSEKTWYCRVQARFVDTGATSAWSATKTVLTLYPLPTVPTLKVFPASTVCPGDCSVPLEWNPATAHLVEGPVEYYVEVDDEATFATPVVMNSGWTASTSWDAAPLATSKAWYWRVRSRDALHPLAVSAWSSVGSFRTMTVEPPPAPGIIKQGNYDSGCADTLVTVTWQPVTSPDGDPVQYYVLADSIGASGWLPATTTSWSFTLPAGWGVTWKVMARDSLHPDAISAWSPSEYFYDIGSQCWSSSCPLVFGWTGSRFDYLTDLAGPIIGLRPSATSREVSLFHPEVAPLNGLRPGSDGKYRVKIRESLPEITYLDTASLLAVDYPQGYEIHPSWAETTYVYGYADPFRIYTAKDPLPPKSAYASNGTDVLASMLAVDNTPAALDPMDDNFYYMIDFGPIAQPQFAKLLIEGWTLYSVDAFPAATLIQPFIEVVDQNGNWVKVKSFGTPAGDLKTMVVDLSNLFLSDDHRIRLHTGMRHKSRWLIDRIRLDQSAPVNVSVQELLAEAADLQFGGNAIESMSDLDSRIIATDLNLPFEGSASGIGNFTRYGDVTSLVADSDDMFAIMRQGDKVDLVFPTPGELPAGFSRGFLLRSDLYYKSLVISNQVEPLPFHGMSNYPYPATESYPTDADHLQYLQQYNTRRYGPPLP